MGAEKKFEVSMGGRGRIEANSQNKLYCVLLIISLQQVVGSTGLQDVATYTGGMVARRGGSGGSQKGEGQNP